MNDPIEEDISGMLRQIRLSGDEDTLFDARQEIYKYQAEALAKPNRVRVEFLRTRLRRKLTEIVGSVRRDGLL